MTPERWEVGSEFHWQDDWSVTERPTPAPWHAHDAGHWGSGRDAMRALLEWGRERHGWRRLWCPDYFCQEVVEALLSTGLEVRTWSDSPLTTPGVPPADMVRARDVVLLVNFFGLRSAPASVPLPDGVVLLEDHTHSPWSDWAWKSGADYCVASLRKTLPVPDGGVLWSPTAQPLPSATGATDERRNAAASKFAAMVLKGMYLDGRRVRKDAFRALALAGEGAIASGAVSGMSPITAELVDTFPVASWNEARGRNFAALAASLERDCGLEVLRPAAPECIPFSVVVRFPNRTLRDSVRAQLIARGVYPAVLWSLDEPVVPDIGPMPSELAGRLLSIHCDMRYDVADMERVAGLVRTAVEVAAVA